MSASTSISEATTLNKTSTAVVLTIYGRVQGVGFRPFVVCAASRCRLVGWVRNDSDGVTVHVEGLADDVARFRMILGGESPPASPPMPPRIIPILGRLRQDIAAALDKPTIEQACRQVNYSWRRRVLDPATTIYLFLLQVLHGNTACQHVVHFGNWSFTDSAYCQARKRLPLAVYHWLLEKIAATCRAATEDTARWLGHRVWLVDGSSFSMPDVPELQAHFGQPGNQKKGCGFPVARWLALFDLTTGMLLRSAAAPLRSHEMSRAAAVSRELRPGDLVLGDRGFCSYAHLALLLGRGLHGVFRIHQRQIVDFTPGRPGTRGNSKDVPGLPRSRSVLAHGDSDQVVVWQKPKQKPLWMTAQEYAALPAEITVRELRYRVEVRGYRVREITLVTTLLDAAVYSAEALADLYFRRWQVEINIRHLKISMKMDVLRCEAVDGVLKELAVFALAYNLVRSVMGESARLQGVEPDRIGLVDALRWLIGIEEGDLSELVINPSRRGRVEPRVKKRRPKQYMLMKKPRSELRKVLPMKHFESIFVAFGTKDISPHRRGRPSGFPVPPASRARTGVR